MSATRYLIKYTTGDKFGHSFAHQVVVSSWSTLLNALLTFTNEQKKNGVDINITEARKYD